METTRSRPTNQQKVDVQTSRVARPTRAVPLLKDIRKVRAESNKDVHLKTLFVPIHAAQLASPCRLCHLHHSAPFPTHITTTCTPSLPASSLWLQNTSNVFQNAFSALPGHTAVMPQPAIQRTHALLPSLAPTLSLSVYHTQGPFIRARRTVQLRGPVLYLLRGDASESTIPSETDTNFILRGDTKILPHGAKAALLHPAHKFVFSTPSERNAFLRETKLAILRERSRIAKYVVLREIGHGGEGVVYLVRKRRKLFAMKVIDKTFAFESQAQISHVIAERVALAEARDRNAAFIIRMVDAFETMDAMCFVAELAAFGDLRSLMRQLDQARFDESIARVLFAEMTMALEEVHRMGFLYRDMKPGNVLVTKHGHIRLADFGLAKKVRMQYEGGSVSSNAGSSSVSDEDEEEMIRLIGRASSFVGTRRFMSPEHLRGGHAPAGYSAPADIWALGVSLYVMLTGEYPFGRDVHVRNTRAMFHAIANDKLTFPSWVSLEAKDLLRGLMDRDTELRLEFDGIKNHPWLADIDWATLKGNARNNIPNEDVVNYLRKQGAKTIQEMFGKDKQMSEGMMISSLSNSLELSKRRASMGTYELLGFGYHNPKQQV